jgi:hypothetical protein
MGASLRSGYRHFNSNQADFERERGGYAVVSINNVALDLDRLGPCRVTRFIRDPRDLIVSGYFYHRRGAEKWCRIVDPDPNNWLVKRNRPVPRAVRRGESLQMALERLDLEEGLLAEMELRSLHFDSMREWPIGDQRIRVWRYEDILGREKQVMSEVAHHLTLPFVVRARVRHNAGAFDVKHAAARKSSHVRNPSSGQWREVFTPRVEAAFMERWGDLLERYGYGPG